MTPTLIFILLFSILPTSTPLKIPENDEVTISPAVNDEANISPTVSYESSLSFEWTGPMSMRLRNRDGDEDDIELRPSQGIGNVQVDCLFVGYLTKDTGGSVGVVGCQQSSLVSITIVSNYSSGTMFNLVNRNQTTVELLVTSVINNYEEEEEEEEEELERDKRSSYYDDDVIYDYVMDDYSFDGAEPIPPSNVYYEFALSYDQAFLTKMNQNITAAEEYITKVATHAQVYFKDPSLGAIVHFVINKNIKYLQGKEFIINPLEVSVKSNIKDARKIETSEPLVIFTKTDDLESWRGIASKRRACDPLRGRAIIKHREDFQRAALTMAHEMGHWFGNLHDGEQDTKNKKDNPDIEHTPCEGQGIMTDSVIRPKKWSECSRQRLATFFTKKGKKCLKPAPACNNDDWVQDAPCSCGDGPKTNLCSSQDKGYCILETATCIDGELVEDIDHQIPEFLFNCLTNRDPWITPCVPFRRYLMIFDSQGNFFQEMTNQNDNSKYLRTSVIKKVQKPKAKDIQEGKGHPNYLLQLERTDQQTGSFFIATKSGQLLVAGSEIMPSLHLRKDHCSQGKDMQVTESPLDMSSTSTESPTTPNIVSTPAPDMDYGCDQAYWRLWKVDGRYLLIGSVTKPGFFLNVEAGTHKVKLGKEEKMTGIYNDEVVFLAGGLNNEATTEVLDLSESSPSCSNPVDPLPSPRWGHTINYVDSTLILCGGMSPTDTWATTMSCIKADTGTGKWVHHSKTTMPRVSHSSAVAGDLHLFSGAYDGALGSLELYKAGQWMNAQSQSFRLGEGSCSARVDEKTVILTGGKYSLKTTSRWNAGDYTLNLFGDTKLNVGRIGHGCDTIVINGKLYIVVAGGMDLRGSALKSSEILDVTEMKEWVMMGDMQRARWAGKLVTVRIAGIPTIFSMGGWNKDDQHMNSVEELRVDTSDLSKSEWILKDVTMNVKRTYFAAVASPKRDFC